MVDIEKILAIPKHWCPSKKEQRKRQAQAIRTAMIEAMPTEIKEAPGFRIDFAEGYNQALTEVLEILGGDHEQ